jgi:hypothetical protein
MRRTWPILAGLVLALSTAQAALQDREPPSIYVLPSRPHPASGELSVQARLRDGTGVGRVTLFARGEREVEFRPFEMRHEPGDLWSCALPPWPGRGSRVAFYVEAEDVLGNGPRRSGHPLGPHFAGVAGGDGSDAVAAAGLAVTLVALVLVLGRLVRRRRSERAFWNALLEPLEHRRGPELILAVDELCAQRHDHPTRGNLVLSQAEVLARLGDGQATSPGLRV